MSRKATTPTTSGTSPRPPADFGAGGACGRVRSGADDGEARAGRRFRGIEPGGVQLVAPEAERGAAAASFPPRALPLVISCGMAMEC